MSELRLSVERRTEFGKGFARRTRKAGKIPAVLYGHGLDPQHLALPAHEFTQAVRNRGANVLITLDFGTEDSLAIPKAIQRNAIKGTFDHVDLIAVRLGEKITVDLPVVVSGEVVSGGLMQLESTTVSVEAEATHIPTEVTVDITGLEIGTQFTAAQLVLPAGTTLAVDPEHVVLIISEAPTAEALDAEAAESVAGAAAAEAEAAAEPSADTE